MYNVPSVMYYMKHLIAAEALLTGTPGYVCHIMMLGHINLLRPKQKYVCFRFHGPTKPSR